MSEEKRRARAPQPIQCTLPLLFLTEHALDAALGEATPPC